MSFVSKLIEHIIVDHLLYYVSPHTIYRVSNHILARKHANLSTVLYFSPKSLYAFNIPLIKIVFIACNTSWLVLVSAAKYWLVLISVL